ncbi:MAG TPA: Clp protease N-terminal domain-containing protein [Acidimicrobiales bacterium]|nr:Clp protease N-terminal domain-containing protein [Acidimicrobiales bacterium]
MPGEGRADGMEGFGQGARRAVAMAAIEARELGSARIGTEHLLLGLLAHVEGAAAKLLGASGVTLSGARRKVGEAVGQRQPSDAEAARARRPGDALERSARAERAIGRAFRFSHEQRSREVRTEHLLLGVLDVEGTAGQVLRGLGVDLDALRAAVEAPSGGQSGASEETADEDVAVGAVPDSRVGPYVPPPSCASCSNPLEGSLSFTVLTAADRQDRKRDVIVVSCRACGAAVGVAR